MRCRFLTAALAVTLVPALAVAQGLFYLINLHPPTAPPSAPFPGVNSEASALTATQQFGYLQVSFDPSTTSLWSGRGETWMAQDPPAGWASVNIVAAAADTAASGTRLAVLLGNFDASPQVIHAAAMTLATGEVIDLHPVPPAPAWLFSFIRGISPDGSRQVGSVTSSPAGNHAALWSGTAASFVDLHPLGATYSSANACTSEFQVGAVGTGGPLRATLWRGTAASRIDLHPAGATGSEALAASGLRQGGYATINGNSHAALWSGTAASFVGLHPTRPAPLPPPTYIASSITGMSGEFQCGTLTTPEGLSHAALWRGTSNDWIDLHSFLPSDALDSRAAAIHQDGPFVSVVGSIYNTSANDGAGGRQAFLWVARCSGCLADFNCSGPLFPPFTDALSVQDVFDFLIAWFSRSRQADFDRNGEVALQDLFEFLIAYLSGCP